jgi:hypothetical protein
MGTPTPFRHAAIAAMVLALGSAPASAVTPDELAALAKEGLGDEVLIALIDASGLSVVVDASAALQLKRQGVSERVIAAAVRASTPPPPVEPVADVCWECEPPAPVSPAPVQPAVVEREVYREVYYVPWVVTPVRPGPVRKPEPYLNGTRRLTQFINDGLSLPRDTKASPRR